ncbi:MAG: small basic protein [Planctomycetia bacterium]|nr:small basic protein [Planctomycetia bacterium]
MTMDQSLKLKTGLARARGVLSRDERLTKLKEMDRWKDGDSPIGLPKVRVVKLSMKKKKKKEAEGDAAAPAAGGKAAAKPAAGAKAAAGAKPAAAAAKPAAGSGAKKK